MSIMIVGGGQETNLTQGPRVMPLVVTTAVAPPETEMALQPRWVLATRQPSVVAMGRCTFSPLSSMGPATPTGMGT